MKPFALLLVALTVSVLAFSAAAQESAPDVSSEPVVLVGRVLTEVGSPASGAVVVSSAGGQAVTDSNGTFQLELVLAHDVRSVRLTAVANGNGSGQVATTRISGLTPGDTVRVDPLRVQQSSVCEAWLPTFGGAPGINGDVRALAVFDDGKGGGPALYAGGPFSIAGGVTANNIAKWDGETWSPLGGGITGTGFVRTLAVFDDGQGPALYAGGTFVSTTGVTPARQIAKWNGSNWSALGGGLNGSGGYGSGSDPSVHALVVFDDGNGDALYVGGGFMFAGSITANRIAKWNGANWSPLETGMNGPGNAYVKALAVFDDGGPGGPALYAGGDFTSAGGVAASHMAKWDGSSWSGLGGGTNDSVHALTVFDSGSGDALYAGGTFTFAGGLAALNIAKWDGAKWSAVGFPGGGTNSDVNALEVFDDGSGPALYAGGDFTVAGTQLANQIAKWDGTMWSSLGGGIEVASATKVWALTVFDLGTGNGPELFAGGRFQAAGTTAAENITHWDGSDWSTLGEGLNNAVSALIAFDDGNGSALYAAGIFTIVAGLPVKRIGKWDGSNWSPLGSGLNSEVRALTVFDDGQGGGPALYAGGEFLNSGGVPVARVAKWDGNTWSALGSGVSAGVNALDVFDDGSGLALYAGGFFSQAGGVQVNHIAKWDGASWSALAGGTNSNVYSLGVFDSGSGPELYAGGDFTTAGSAQAPGVARWDGTSWSPLGNAGNGTNSAVRSMAVFDDGSGPELYTGGSFTVAGALLASRIAKWDGSDWHKVGSGMNNGTVSALRVFDDGSGPALYAGGSFAFAGAVPTSKIAKWDGVSWSQLGTGSGMNLGVRALEVFDDGSGTGPALFIGGFFPSSASGDSYLAKWGCPLPEPVTNFCTAKTTLVCGAANIGASGTPSATATSGFVIAAQPVRGCRAGLLLYTSQPNQSGGSFGGPGNGLLCLSAGLRRAGPVESGGSSPQACDGILSIDMNQFRALSWTTNGCTPTLGQTNPAAYLGNIGTTVNAQMWGRDSTGTGQVVSDGISWSIGP